MSTRRRLPPDERRRELVDVAAREFAAKPYDAVAMDEVAERAGVSRALLYTYFASKRDLFAAVYRAAADDLLELTTFDPQEPLVPQIEAGLDAHIDYFVANRNAVLTANRVLAGDPVIQTIISDELSVLRERVLDARGLEGPERAALSTVLLAWLIFVRVLCVEWLVRPGFSRAALRDICTGALVGALQPVLPTDSPAQSTSPPASTPTVEA